MLRFLYLVRELHAVNSVTLNGKTTQERGKVEWSGSLSPLLAVVFNRGVKVVENADCIVFLWYFLPKHFTDISLKPLNCVNLD